MEIELHPAMVMQTGTFNALVAPEELVLSGINDNPALRRFLFLFVCGNMSRILPGINRRSGLMEVQRSFTAYQLLTILSEAHHTILFLEHDPSLYEDAEGVLETVSEALAAAARDALVILYAPRSDPAFDRLARRADRVFFFSAANPHAPPRRQARRTAGPRTVRGGQTTLGVF
jgi:hypothetical protein